MGQRDYWWHFLNVSAYLFLLVVHQGKFYVPHVTARFFYPAPLIINTFLTPPPYQVFVFFINHRSQKENLDTDSVVRRGSTQNYPMPPEQSHPAHDGHPSTYLPQSTNFNEGIAEKVKKSQNVPSGEDFSRCGVRSSLNAALRSEPTGSSSKTLLTSLDWDPPDLSKTTFAKLIGAEPLLGTKITFGIKAKRNEAPWQVAIFVNGKFHCGASVISPRCILTAAHCVTQYKNTPESLKLSIGDWDLKSTTDGQHIESVVDKVVVHPSYSLEFLKSDIAILRLKKPLKFNHYIRPVCLAVPGVKLEGNLLTVTGWGRNENQKLVTVLQKLSAFALTNDDCALKWARKGAPRSLISSKTLCMSTQLGDSCKGDSGGPCVMEYPAGSGQFTQMGIVSFGSGSCRDITLPGVYTRVSSYYNWIQQKIVELNKNA